MKLTTIIRNCVETEVYRPETLVEASNYCLREILSNPDDELYTFDDFCDLLDMCEFKSSDIIMRTRFGDVDFSKDFFGFDGYANFRSLYSWEAAREAIDNILSALDADPYDLSDLLDILEIEPDDHWDDDDDDDDE